MLRIIVSVLAAFVGFSFGHSIPKWMESKSKSCLGSPSPALHEPPQRANKLSFRRKSLRKFRFTLQKPGKVCNGEENGSLHKLCRDGDDGEIIMPLHKNADCVKVSRHTHSFRRKLLKFALQKPGKVIEDEDVSLHKLCRDDSDDAEINMPLHVNANPVEASRLYASHKEPKKLKFESQKLRKGQSKTRCPNSELDSDANLDPQCQSAEQDLCVNPKHVSHQAQAGYTDENITRHPLCQIASSRSNAICIPQQDVHVNKASQKDSELVSCKSSPLHGSCGSPTKEKSQMKQWKMKLISLRSKAMASEKAWNEKFDSENCGGMLLVESSTGSMMAIKKTAEGKENESPCQIGTKKKDFFWSRSSSKAGLLLEGPKLAFER